MDQYKEAVRTLNKELTVVTEKLKQESILRKKEQEAKKKLEAKLTAICGQVETTRADAITEFKASQPFIDACTIYYGDKFKDYLKHVKTVYPNLDLAKVSMDDPLSTTLTRDDTVSEETDDSTKSEWDSKDDGVVLAQPAIERLVASLDPSANDPLLGPSTHDTQNLDA
nr:hypothetical protein CFP56_42309 [Quercus suber]